jgi:hypothetical protein
MAGGARFQFVAGRRRHGVSVPTWPGGDSEEVTEGTWFAWRLLGGNNRDLGRSAQVFSGPDECRAAVKEVRGRAGDLVAVILVEADSGMWTWRLELDGSVVAVAARPYYRQREGQYNLSQFLAALADAALSDAVLNDLGPTSRRDERPAATWGARGVDRFD